MLEISPRVACALALLLQIPFAAAQPIPITTATWTDALSTVAQRHMVRVAPGGGAPVLLIAVQRGTRTPEGLRWYRSDDDGASWREYRAIHEDGVAGRELHFTADAVVVGNDVAIVWSYDTVTTGFPSSSDDPRRVVFFQRWRWDGSRDWTPGARVQVAAPPSGSAYHRAVLAADGRGRLWVQAWLRGPCSSSAGATCPDTLRLWSSGDGGATFAHAKDLVTQSMLAGGRLVHLGGRLMMLWGDYSWSNPAQVSFHSDGDAPGTWSAPARAFSDGESIYHGAALSAAPDGAGGLHLVYKDRYERLYYRRFDGSAFGGRTLVESVAHSSVQPAITRAGGEVYVCTNSLVSGGTHVIRAYRLSRGFGTWQVLDTRATQKAYPSAPVAVPSGSGPIPCAYASSGSPVRIDAVRQPADGSAPPPPPATPDFTLSLQPSSLTVAAGGQATSTVTLSPSGGFTGDVTLSISGAPAGVSSGFNPTTVAITSTSARTSTLTLSAAANAVAASSTATVTARGGTLTRTAALPVTVTSTTAPPPPDSGSGTTAAIRDAFTSLDATAWLVETRVTGDSAGASGGVLTLTPAASSGSAGVFVTRRTSASFTGSSLTVRVPSVVARGNLSCKLLLVGAGTKRWSHRFGFWYENGTLYLATTVNGVDGAVASLGYSPTTHAWWRLRESGGSTIWETSPDGVAWAEGGRTASSSLGLDLSAVNVAFEVKAWGTGNPTPGAAKFSNLNAGP